MFRLLLILLIPSFSSSRTFFSSSEPYLLQSPPHTRPSRLTLSLPLPLPPLSLSHPIQQLVRAGSSTDLDEFGFITSLKDGLKKDEARLSERGRIFAQELRKLIMSHTPVKHSWYKADPSTYSVYTSTYLRAAQTIAPLFQDMDEKTAPNLTILSALNYLDKGLCEGKTALQMSREYPHVLEGLAKNPRSYRYPGGESYNDMVKRLDVVVNDIERQTQPVLVVSHLSCLRALYAYFKEKSVESCLAMNFPQHTVIEFSSTQYGWKESWYDYRSKVDDIYNQGVAGADRPIISRM